MAGSRRAWGWHQLDGHWARALVADSQVGPGDLVLDVGAGLGAITEPLVASGARVIAVEIHPQRLAHLRERFGDRALVVRADASDLRLPRRPFHVVACPPYGVTSPLLARLLHQGSRMISAHLVLQDAAARRWSGARAPGGGRWRASFSATLGPPVPRDAFHPPPHVQSRVLVVRRRGAS